jgi:predicted nucleic acid-binding protein
VRVALDTNVLAYAEGVNGPSMKALALELVGGLPPASVLLPVQTLAILSWRDAFCLFETSAATMLSAADLAVTHQFGIWDAAILSAAAEADCSLLLSEDMQDGLVWRGVTIANPFERTKHPLLQALLSDNL